MSIRDIRAKKVFSFKCSTRSSPARSSNAPLRSIKPWALVFWKPSTRLELKSIKELHPAHEAQLVNYLKATGLEVGLLINFGERVEIKRKVFTPRPPPADSPDEFYLGPDYTDTADKKEGAGNTSHPPAVAGLKKSSTRFLKK